MSLGHEDAMSVFPSFFINLLLLPVDATGTQGRCCLAGAAEGVGDQRPHDDGVSGLQVSSSEAPWVQPPCLSTSPGSAAGQGEGNITHPEAT